MEARRPALNLQAATVLIAGCGDLGCEISRCLTSEGITVAGLRRSAQPLPHGILTVQGDVTVPHTLQQLADLRPKILIYSVAADERSDEGYRRQYVEGLRNMLAALGQPSALRHVFFVSSTRVYGQDGAALLDERTPALAADFGGRRLLEAEGLLRDLPFGGTVLRLSGIYGPGRTRMLRLAVDPATWPQDNTWTNRIHRDDAAAFTAQLVRRALAGESVDDCYIVTDSEPAPQYAVLLWLAQQLDVAADTIAVPPPEGGKRLSNARLLQTGFRLAYADYRAGYGALLKTRL